MLLEPNTVLQNRYHIVRLISQGGMGAVYEATDERLGNTVALKQIVVNDQRMRETLEREARLLAQLQHSVLPMVSDHFAEKTGEFLVMQYIPGEDLGMMLLEEDPKFSADEILRWADQLLDALDYLHGQYPPIVHRDIKPRNLKLTPRRDIILLDFGLAKRSQTVYKDESTGRNVRILTPEYAPLEQIQGNDNDPRSDLYSLAATLYHLLTGTSPPDTLTRAAAVLSEQLDPLRPANELTPNISPALAVILHQAMSQNLDQRFATAKAMRTALRVVYKQGLLVGPRSSSRNSGDGQSTTPAIRKDSSAITTTTPSSPSSRKHSSSAPKALPSSATLIVSKNEQGYFQTIQEAMEHSGPGTRIFVRPGLYREAIVIKHPLEIIGDGPVGDIFLECTKAPCIQMATSSAVVRGISIRGRAGTAKQKHVAVDIPSGRLVLEECDISSDTLACVHIHSAQASPIVWNCRIHGGESEGVVIADHAQGIIEDCDIFSNGGPGIVIRQIGNPIIRQCKIHHGERDGIHITDKGAGVVEGCDIFSNARSGVHIERNSNPFIRLCQIHDQMNGYGFYIHSKGEGTIEGCNIFSNAKAGVGITQGGNPFIRRCRIHHEKQRGVFVFENGEGTIERCSIIANFETGVTIGQGSDPFIRRCRINQNALQGIRVLPHGRGNVEECDLTGNIQGAWDVATKSKLRQNGNVE